MKLTARNTNQKGFTLIELLVVIGILAILLAITLVAVNPARQFAQSRDTQRRNDVLQTLNAVHQYMADNAGNEPGAFTTTPTDLTGIAGLCAALVTDYMPVLPVDPETGPATGPIPAADCATNTANTGYLISQDTDGRITVSATPEVATSIDVTR